VDIHIGQTEPAAAERDAVDGLLGAPAEPADRVGRKGSSARFRRALLLPGLHAINDRVGWISAGALNYLCERLCVPPAEAYGVASFYELFATEPRPARMLHVCDDIVCLASGAGGICERLERAGTTNWRRSQCLGQCDRAPAALVTQAGDRPRVKAVAPMRAQYVVAIAEGAEAFRLSSAPLPQAGDAGLRLLRRVGRIDPASLDEYRAHDGYAALRRALDIGPAAIVREVITSKLFGRGGAAFPTGRKWQAVAAQAQRPHYVVCNADESEPGTFKDRLLMEEDPFAIVEAMTIVAVAGGCEQGYVYVRGEYPLAYARLTHAIDAARAQGLLGVDVMGAGVRFDIDVRRGAGAYVCGEETALLNSLEGHRGEPRNRPPYPTEHGLFGKPTIVNNVETLANVPDIVRLGGAAFASIGTPDSAGTKLFSVCGHVARPGVYEVPLGFRLRELIALAGGVRAGGVLKAVLLGGAAGVFLTPDELDVALSLDGVRAVDAPLGSGAVAVFDNTTDLEAVVQRIAEFFRRESCGKCVPCRVGTVRQRETLRRLAERRPLVSVASERELLTDIGRAMRDASICGLGQSASSAVETALAKFALFARGQP
jgi:NADH-quinone oxidoreductase subunit F